MTIISSGPLIGPVLAAIRSAAGVSQQALTDRTGVANGQISKYELSVVIPTIDVAARLLAGLNHRLVVLPAGHAAGQQERQAVIDAAKWVAENETEPFTDRLQRLELAVEALPLHADLPSSNPYAEIAELRSRLEQEQRKVARLQSHVSTAVQLLGEAGR